MKTKEEIIQEGNRKIVIFMGYKLITPAMRRTPSEWTMSYWENAELGSRRVLCGENYLNYHCNWNRMMEVIEKINTLQKEKPGYCVILNGKTCIIDFYTEKLECVFSSVKKDFTKTLLENTFEAIVEFIDWYGSNVEITTINE